MKYLTLAVALLLATALRGQCPTIQAEPTAEAVSAAPCGTWEVSGFVNDSPVTLQYRKVPDTLQVRFIALGECEVWLQRPDTPQDVFESLFLFNGWTEPIR